MTQNGPRLKLCFRYCVTLATMWPGTCHSLVNFSNFVGKQSTYMYSYLRRYVRSNMIRFGYMRDEWCHIHEDELFRKYVRSFVLKCMYADVMYYSSFGNVRTSDDELCPNAHVKQHFIFRNFQGGSRINHQTCVFIHRRSVRTSCSTRFAVRNLVQRLGATSPGYWFARASGITQITFTSPVGITTFWHAKVAPQLRLLGPVGGPVVSSVVYK